MLTAAWPLPREARADAARLSLDGLRAAAEEAMSGDASLPPVMAMALRAADVEACGRRAADVGSEGGGSCRGHIDEAADRDGESAGDVGESGFRGECGTAVGSGEEWLESDGRSSGEERGVMGSSKFGGKEAVIAASCQIDKKDGSNGS